jgi:hypothetical protein
MKSPSISNNEQSLGFFRVFASSHFLLMVAICMALANGVLHGQDGQSSNVPPKAKDPQTAAGPAEAANYETKVAAAREQAILLHRVYSATLDVLHHRYFRRDGSVLPARAMEDVFEEMVSSSGTYANWISVNTKAMNIDHEPSTDFEKKAAEEISTGKEAYELAGKAVYRRATAIPLRSSCVGCHTKMFSTGPTSPRFAALVITIHLDLDKK